MISLPGSLNPGDRVEFYFSSSGDKSDDSDC